MTSQGAAPNSVVAEFVCPLKAIGELWFADDAVLRAAAGVLKTARCMKCANESSSRRRLDMQIGFTLTAGRL